MSTPSTKVVGMDGRPVMMSGYGGGSSTGGAGPPDNGEMEARVAKLEAQIDHVQRDIGEIKADLREIKNHARTDFRLLFGALIAVALGLAGLMAKGFHWL